MTTGKRLTAYAMRAKGALFAALLLLTVSVAADLAGPFVAKRVIDDHILGIQSHWYETGEGENAVLYEDSWYTRDAYVTGEKPDGPVMTIIQSGKDFYAANGKFDLELAYRSDEGTLKNQEGEIIDSEALTAGEVYRFYQPEIPRIINLLGLYFGLLVIAAFFQYGQSYLLQNTANRIIQGMRKDLFRHLSTLPVRFFDRFPAGKIVARITNDTESIRELYVNVLANFFSAILYITGIYIALFILNAKLALLALIFIPILIAWMLIYRKFASRYNKVIQAKISELNAMVNESIQGMPIIQAFSRERKIKEEFEEVNDVHFTYQKKLVALNSVTSFNMVNLLQNLSFLAFILYFGNIGLNGSGIVSVGLLYAFIDYLNRLFQPVQWFVNQFASLEQALVAGNRVFELLDEKGTPVEQTSVPRFEGEVEFRNVSFGYEDGLHVLKDISFTVKKGQTVAFVGHTGSGKSSIMNILFRYYDTQQGAVFVDGKDIKDIPVQSLREHMAIVLQDPFLFTGTIASNVSLDNPAISRADVESALCDTGADLVLRHLKEGIDAPVTEKGGTLSAGQRQLISFSRALAKKPAILILDEATSSVDTETEQIIQKALDVLKRGRTTFIIAHRLSTIKDADQIYVLDGGRIKESGNHEALMELDGQYAHMYRVQAGEEALI